MLPTVTWIIFSRIKLGKTAPKAINSSCLVCDGPGHLWQTVQDGLWEVAVGDIMLQQQHLILRVLLSNVAQLSHKVTLL